VSHLRYLPYGFPRHLIDLNSFEASFFEYFRLVCSRDLALYFESPWWEGLVLEYVHAEPSIYHAAIAISSMSRNEYYPTTTWNDPGRTRSSAEYCLTQYNQAVRCLNHRLDSSVESIELAIIASILFIYIEGMQGRTVLMRMHLEGGLALVRSGAHSPNAGNLQAALLQIQDQVREIQSVEKS
jgi:hypothetical protein